MKKYPLLLTALLLTPALLALRPAATRLKFAPADGTSLEKTFETKATLTLDSFTVTGAPTQPDMEMTITTNQKVTVVDDYATVKDGAPKKLTRSYDELAGDTSAASKMSVMGQTTENSQNMRLKSELAGKKVVFKWNDEKSEYDKTFDPEEDKPDLLEGLAEDMDFRGFLPKDEVNEGDTWTPDAAHMLHVFAPGGKLALMPENVDDTSLQMGADEMSSLSNAIGEKLEGEVKAKLTGIKTVDGVTSATIHIEVKVKSSADMTEDARKSLEKVELPPGTPPLEIDHLDMEFAFEGEGDLVWNVSAGHFQSFELTGQTTLKSETGIKLDLQGRSMEIEQKREMSGSTSYTASAKSR